MGSWEASVMPSSLRLSSMKTRICAYTHLPNPVPLHTPPYPDFAHSSHCLCVVCHSGVQLDMYKVRCNRVKGKRITFNFNFLIDVTIIGHSFMSPFGWTRLSTMPFPLQMSRACILSKWYQHEPFSEKEIYLCPLVPMRALTACWDASTSDPHTGTVSSRAQDISGTWWVWPWARGVQCHRAGHKGLAGTLKHQTWW